MVESRKLISGIANCIRELESIKEMIEVLHNSDYINDEVADILIDRGILFSEESDAMKEAREVLRESSTIGKNDIIVCPKCNTIVEIYGDERLEVLDDVVWMTDGCPYCKNKKLDLLQNAKD